MSLSLQLKLSEIVRPGQVVELEPDDKPALLARLCGALEGDPRVLDAAALHRAVVEREAVASTALGMGVAIPHAKIAAVTDCVLAIGRARGGVDFGALDGQPVRLVFLVGASLSHAREFVRLLAKVTRLVREARVRDELLAARLPDEFLEIVRRHE